MKNILLGIAVILFGISITMVSSGLSLGMFISFGGLILSLYGYSKDDNIK